MDAKRGRTQNKKKTIDQGEEQAARKKEKERKKEGEKKKKNFCDNIGTGARRTADCCIDGNGRSNEGNVRLRWK